MTRRVLFLSLSLALAVLGCAGTKPKAPAEVPLEPWQEGIIGYRWRGSNVVFEFDQGWFDKATRRPGGASIHFQGFTVANVSVVGPFNDWTPGSWPMERAGSRRFVLEKSASSIGASGAQPFAFVVNGSWWVEPPKAAKNIAPAGPDGVSLVVELR